MSAKFPGVSKRPIVPGIIDLPRFNYEDLEEIVTVRNPFDGPCGILVRTNIAR